MARESTHTVFGFGCGLDWRPTVFLDGIPCSRVCDACGLVPSRTASLSCRHVFCQTCYGRCVDSGNLCCLDGDAIKCYKVVWTSFPTHNLLQRKIRCWNTSRGCDMSGPASAIIDHFKDCHHHPVPCPRCKQSVAHTEVVHHIKSGLCAPCTDENLPGPTFEAAVTTTANVLCQLDRKVCFLQTTLQQNFDRFAACVEALRKGAEVSVPVPQSVQLLGAVLQKINKEKRETKGAAGGSVVASVAHSVQQLSRYVESLHLSQEGSFQDKFAQLFAASTENIGALKESAASACTERGQNIGNVEISGERTQGIDVAKPLPERYLQRFCLETTKTLKFLELASKLSLHYKQCEYKTFEWYLEKWTELKEASRNGREAVSYAEEAEYFYGYSILPGMEIVTVDDVTTLSMVFCICKGEYDKLLTWPMKQKFFFQLLHPEVQGARVNITVNTAANKLEEYYKPNKPDTKFFRSLVKVDVAKLDADGFIEDNTLWARLTVSAWRSG